MVKYMLWMWVMINGDCACERVSVYVDTEYWSSTEHLMIYSNRLELELVKVKRRGDWVLMKQDTVDYTVYINANEEGVRLLINRMKEDKTVDSIQISSSGCRGDTVKCLGYEFQDWR